MDQSQIDEFEKNILNDKGMKLSQTDLGKVTLLTILSMNEK